MGLYDSNSFYVNTNPLGVMGAILNSANVNLMKNLEEMLKWRQFQEQQLRDQGLLDYYATNSNYMNTLAQNMQYNLEKKKREEEQGIEVRDTLTKYLTDHSDELNKISDIGSLKTFVVRTAKDLKLPLPTVWSFLQDYGNLVSKEESNQLKQWQTIMKSLGKKKSSSSSGLNIGGLNIDTKKYLKGKKAASMLEFQGKSIQYTSKPEKANERFLNNFAKNLDDVQYYYDVNIQNALSKGDYSKALFYIMKRPFDAPEQIGGGVALNIEGKFKALSSPAESFFTLYSKDPESVARQFLLLSRKVKKLGGLDNISQYDLKTLKAKGLSSSELGLISFWKTQAARVGFKRDFEDIDYEDVFKVIYNPQAADDIVKLKEQMQMFGDNIASNISDGSVADKMKKLFYLKYIKPVFKGIGKKADTLFDEIQRKYTNIRGYNKAVPEINKSELSYNTLNGIAGVIKSWFTRKLKNKTQEETYKNVLDFYNRLYTAFYNDTKE